MPFHKFAAFARLGRLDRPQKDAGDAYERDDFEAARDVTGRLKEHLQIREQGRWALKRFDRLAVDQLDAPSLLRVAETVMMDPLDWAAIVEVERAARQVATITALVPLALLDVATVLIANFRMIRRIAEIYGGRSGFLGSWRLTRAVLTHLAATGAVAVGDDLLEPIIGGTVLSKLSRRFGEGLVNGALTARVGVAAIEICRPLPFVVKNPPRAGKLIKSALGGLLHGG